MFVQLYVPSYGRYFLRVSRRPTHYEYMYAYAHTHDGRMTAARAVLPAP